MNEDGDAFLDSAFQDLVEVFDLRYPSSMLLCRLLLGVVTAWSLRVTKRDNSDVKSFVVLICGLQDRLTIDSKLHEVCEPAINEGYQGNAFMDLLESDKQTGKPWMPICPAEPRGSEEQFSNETFSQLATIWPISL